MTIPNDIAAKALKCLSDMHEAWPTNDDVRAWREEFETIRAALQTRTPPVIKWDDLYEIMHRSYKQEDWMADELELWLYYNDPRKAGEKG